MAAHWKSAAPQRSVWAVSMFTAQAKKIAVAGTDL